MTTVNCPKCSQPVDLPEVTDNAGVEVNDFPCPHCGEEIALVAVPPAEPTC